MLLILIQRTCQSTENSMYIQRKKSDRYRSRKTWKPAYLIFKRVLAWERLPLLGRGKGIWDGVCTPKMNLKTGNIQIPQTQSMRFIIYPVDRIGRICILSVFKFILGVQNPSQISFATLLVCYSTRSPRRGAPAPGEGQRNLRWRLYPQNEFKNWQYTDTTDAVHEIYYISSGPHRSDLYTISI